MPNEDSDANQPRIKPLVGLDDDVGRYMQSFFRAQNTKLKAIDTRANKMDTDIKWKMKAAWHSADLRERQQKLETYSMEMAAMFDCVSFIASKACGKDIPTSDLAFYANFGSPITDNQHKISIKLVKPVELNIVLTRTVIEGDLEWSAAIASDSNLEISRLLEVQKLGKITLGTKKQPNNSANKRKVKI